MSFAKSSTIFFIFRLMDNAKLIGFKKNEVQKNLSQAVRYLQEINIEFRTMDRDINTVRPQLMKLQRNKDEYTRWVRSSESVCWRAVIGKGGRGRGWGGYSSVCGGKGHHILCGVGSGY